MRIMEIDVDNNSTFHKERSGTGDLAFFPSFMAIQHWDVAGSFTLILASWPQTSRQEGIQLRLVPLRLSIYSYI